MLDVCHGQLERERQLVLFLVFEHLEEDLAGYLNRVGERGMSLKTIQVTYMIKYHRIHHNREKKLSTTVAISYFIFHMYKYQCVNVCLLYFTEICKGAHDWC